VGCIGRMLWPIMNVLLQLHADCVSYHCGDSRVERLVHSITVVLQAVQLYIISIHYSVVDRVRVEKTSLGHEHSYYDII
jgi:hypothetical protein